MILRFATANENHWEREDTTSVVPQETHLQEALAAEGYLSALQYLPTPQGLKPLFNTLRDGTTEVAPSRTRKAYFHRSSHAPQVRHCA